MKMDMQTSAGRGIPVAIVITLLLQGAAAVWWVSARARDSVFVEQRVERLEDQAGGQQKSQELVLQRLARIEERIDAQKILLERIDKRVRE